MKKFQRSTKWVLAPVDNHGNFALVPLVAKEQDLRAVIQINESAAAIWSCLEEPCSESDLLTHFSEKFAVDSASNWQLDVQACLQQYLEASVVLAHEDGA